MYKFKSYACNKSIRGCLAKFSEISKLDVFMREVPLQSVK